MMTRVLVLLLFPLVLLVNGSANASANANAIITYKGVQISHAPSEAQKLVDQGISKASLASNNSNKMKTKKASSTRLHMSGENPADLLCVEIKGIPENIKEEKSGDEISICRMSDGSFIVSWDLIKIIK
ncbi:MAG: DUF333 domain-containing protein [Oligoflexia bacterium]|nr:DUF333 domain-containing protein [Oligoflexia bacterium]MBF0365436.1 DUF333 domain-containing protein [Oligoflexia bacterium]